VRPAFARARSHPAAILLPGFVVGLLLGLSTMVVTRWGHPWFAISLGVVVAVMMICYVAVPARLIGVKKIRSRREKLTIGAVASAMGAIVSTPGYILGRVAILMLGFQRLLIPGIALLTFAAVLQTAATSAVKAVKMSSSLTARRPSGVESPDDRET
jgi:cytochrome c biogenesis factor